MCEKKVMRYTYIEYFWLRKYQIQFHELSNLKALKFLILWQENKPRSPDVDSRLKVLKGKFSQSQLRSAPCIKFPRASIYYFKISNTHMK